MDDFLKKYLGRMTVSQKQRTLTTWAYVPVVRFGLINLAVMLVVFLPKLIPDVLPWQLEDLLNNFRNPVIGFCCFNLTALGVFTKLRAYARNHPSMKYKFKKTGAKPVAKPA